MNIKVAAFTVSEKSSNTSSTSSRKAETPWIETSLTKLNQNDRDEMGLVATKPVFWVSDKASFKPVSSASEFTYDTFQKRITRR